MIYAEKVTANQIEKGVFFTLAEFVPYRAEGWVATSQYNEAADREIERLRGMSDTSLKYLASMIGMATERWEYHRRRNDKS
jgi:hypothetical protein